MTVQGGSWADLRETIGASPSPGATHAPPIILDPPFRSQAQNLCPHIFTMV